MDCAANLSGESGPPQPGDYTVCLSCGAFLHWVSRMRLRTIPKYELDAMPLETLMELAHIRRLITHISRHDKPMDT